MFLKIKIYKHCRLLLSLALLLTPVALLAQQKSAPPRGFTLGTVKHWDASGSIDVRGAGDERAFVSRDAAQVLLGDTNNRFADVVVEGDVSVAKNDVSAGFLVRANKPGPGSTGGAYGACIRKLGVGYVIVQLFRYPDGVLLQEARIRGTVKPDQLVHLKVACKKSSLWVWANDMTAPAITESDDTISGPGYVGLKSDGAGSCLTRVMVRAVTRTPRAPLVRDWSGVKGAVFITSESVNSYQMWEEYHPDIVERELGYAEQSGLNTVEVYLNFLMWQKYGQTYLDRIEDFLKRTDKHHLKTTFILFDDVGNVEPPHLAPYAAPLPGVHNSQMQGCPGRDIIDNRYSEYRVRLKAYVQAIVSTHKNDARIAFWQTYNEPSHATTIPLLRDAYAWIKDAGSRIPVTATGGGAFYGGYYSVFPTFHSYLDPNAPPTQGMVLGDGGSEHLCTETLDRPGVDVPKLVRYFGERKTGWVIWELMIGRDPCRFPWGSPQGAPEPMVPFHGLLYPDGHPWSKEDIKVIQNTP